MSNPCQNEHLLSAYIDGELSDSATQRVHRHLENCALCRRELMDIEAADRILQKLEGVAPSAEFEPTFWAKVDELREQQENRWWRRFIDLGWRPALAAGLAAGVMFGVFNFTKLNNRISPEDRFVAENVDFLTEYDLIENLEILENWEDMNIMKELS